MKCRRDGGECRRKGCEQNDDDKDQPNVIRFPDGPDGVCNEGALFRSTPAKSKQIPNAAAVIRATKQRIQDKRCHDDTGDDRFKRQGLPSFRMSSSESKTCLSLEC